MAKLVTRTFPISRPTQRNVSPVTINLATGYLVTQFSSQRYKEDIKPMSKASEALLRAQTGHLPIQKGDRSNQARDFGLIAEEVAKVNPKLSRPGSERATRERTI